VGSAILFGNEKAGWSHAKLRDKPNILMVEVISAILFGKEKTEWIHAQLRDNPKYIDGRHDICNTVCDGQK
jgi:hypothetical protein